MSEHEKSPEQTIDFQVRATVEQLKYGHRLPIDHSRLSLEAADCLEEDAIEGDAVVEDYAKLVNLLHASLADEFSHISNRDELAEYSDYEDYKNKNFDLKLVALINVILITKSGIVLRMNEEDMIRAIEKTFSWQDLLGKQLQEHGNSGAVTVTADEDSLADGSIDQLQLVA